MRLLSCVVCCALSVAFVAADEKKTAWATVKGRVVFPEDRPVPKPAALMVPANQAGCLKGGQLLDPSVVVNPKNRGVKNAVVWLRPDDATDPKAKFAPGQVHPDDAKRKPAEVAIDQPCLLFLERVTAARVGDTLVVKNSAAIPHNFFWSSTNNGDLNVNIAPGGKHVFAAPLAPEPAPVQYKCTIHPWMTGYVRVFDHPYYAVTDDDGNFEIRNAPVGKFRIVFWHETTGVRGGRAGRFGEVINITGPTVEMKPTEFEVGAK